MTNLRKLYNNMPLYARMLDEMGVLEHICNSIQPLYDTIFWRLEQREEFFDPNVIPEQFLDWLQQFIFGSGAIAGKHWLGVGLNPNWPAYYKREAIYRMAAYWKTKGTEPGIREAIDLWLRWPEQATNLSIIKPFDRRQDRILPNWWDYFTPYGNDLNQPFIEKQQLGSGDYFQDYQPNWVYLYQDPWKWLYTEVWSDCFLASSPAPIIQETRSELGPRCCWMDFSLNKDSWNKIFPNIHELNWDIWDAIARPSVLGWLDYTDGILQLSSLVLDKAENNDVKQYEIVFDINGFQYYDIYPCNTFSTEWDETNVIQETKNFQSYPGFSYQEIWPAIRKEINLIINTEKKAIPGFFAEYGYESTFSSLNKEEIIIVNITESKNNFYVYQEYKNQIWHQGQWWNNFLDNEWGIEFECIEIKTGGECWANTTLLTETIITENSIWSDNIPGGNYYSNYREWIEEKTEIIHHPPELNYVPGFYGDISHKEIYTNNCFEWAETVVLTGFAVDPIEYTIIVQSADIGILGWDWFCVWDKSIFDDFESINSFEVDLSLINQIVNDFNIAITIPDYRKIYTSNNTLSKSPIMGITEKIIIPGYIQFSYNPNITFYTSTYNTGGWWFHQENTQTINVYTQVESVTGQFCNFIDHYSTRDINNYAKIPIELPVNTEEFSMEKIYPSLRFVKNASKWTLIVETLEKTILMKPITSFFVNKDGNRSQSFSLNSSLYLEFLSYLDITTQIKSIALWLEGDQHIIYDTFWENLNVSKRGRFGSKFLIPIKTN